MSQTTQQFCELSTEMLDQAMAKIEHCVQQLSETQIWWRPESSCNSIGNLILHLSGNLRQWGVTPFTMAKDRRDRDAEFATQPQPKIRELLNTLRQTVADAKNEWDHLNCNQLNRQVTIQGFDVTLMHAIMHTSHHFVGHTHQIVMLTRMQLRSNYQFHWTPEEERHHVPV